MIIQPATVVRWHREGFRRFYTGKSEARSHGRPALDREVIGLIRRMSTSNFTWGARRIRNAHTPSPSGDVRRRLSAAVVPSSLVSVLHARKGLGKDPQNHLQRGMVCVRLSRRRLWRTEPGGN